MSENTLNRVTGLLVIEVRNSNPNGDPDNEGEPRMMSHSKLGMISAVSFKRKLRDLVEEKEGPVWDALSKELGIDEKTDGFQILESRGRKRDEIKKLSRAEFQGRYWDARVFGTTFLESIKEDKSVKSEDIEHFIRTGVVQFTNAVSVAPVNIERMTTTNKSGVEEGKDRGMAPLGYRVVQHAVYCMPFFINPTAASRSGCQLVDIDLVKRLIPYAYPHTASYVRPAVEIRHAWYAEHDSPLGSCSDFAILDALTPKKRENPDEPSDSWDEYEVPSSVGDLEKRGLKCMDLMER